MQKPIVHYDEISDTLTITFEPGVKATGIELTDHILLRIDKVHRKAIGMALMDYSLLAQKADFGPRSFPVTGLSEMSEELREIVLDVLQKPPVNDILALSTYTPSHTEAIPITSIHTIPTSAG